MTSGTATIGVYGIVHRASGRIYVGSSKNVVGRWRDHKKRLNGPTPHQSPLLQDLWSSDGADAFRFVVLEVCDVRQLFAREQSWMDIYGTSLLLNASHVAKAASVDPIVAAKIARALTGRRHSDERRANISKGKKGVVTEAICAYHERRSREMKGQPGRPLSAAAKDKIRASWILRRQTPVSAETRAKQSAAHKGRRSTLPVTFVCNGCGQTFSTFSKPSRPRKICSRDCFRAWMRSAHRDAWAEASQEQRRKMSAAIIASNQSRRGEIRSGRSERV